MENPGFSSFGHLSFTNERNTRDMQLAAIGNVFRGERKKLSINAMHKTCLKQQKMLLRLRKILDCYLEWIYEQIHYCIVILSEYVSRDMTDVQWVSESDRGLFGCLFYEQIGLPVRVSAGRFAGRTDSQISLCPILLSKRLWNRLGRFDHWPDR